MIRKIGAATGIAASVLVSACGGGEPSTAATSSPLGSPNSVSSAAPTDTGSSLSEQERLLKETGLLIRTENPPTQQK